jgi:cytochrome c oxidase subunit 2
VNTIVTIVRLRAPVGFTPTREGTYDIACSQLCGLAHFRMRGIITVGSHESFRRFLAGEAAVLA